MIGRELNGRVARVAIVRYQKPLESVRRAIELSRGLEGISSSTKVFIKPNIVFWTRFTPFPKWGVITTSRVVEDVVAFLNEKGVKDITIGEGIVTLKPNDRETPAHAVETLGYNRLKERYGLKIINVFERPFEEVDLDGLKLNFNVDALHSDLIIDLPVLKTHAQTVVSLGIKNLKGLIDVESRKRSHTPEGEKNLHTNISMLADSLPPIFTLIDGIYSNERGPNVDGKIHRSDLLIASSDILSADMVGAAVLGYSAVPHLLHAARRKGRKTDLSDVEIVGCSLDEVRSYHEYSFQYSEDGSLPLPFEKMGIKGLSYRKYDETMCTYCSGINGVILRAIMMAWDGKPWDDIEVLTGKIMKPTPGKKKTILLGKCMYEANKDDPRIKEMIAVRGCPPSVKAVVRAFHKAGIELDPTFLDNIEMLPGFLMGKYEGRPEFDESFFRIG
jgi:uncharacterized protein (DUF362 family)